MFMSFKFWGLILFILIISSCKKEISAPTVKTTLVQIDKNNNNIIVTGNVTSEGASAVSKRGFCWSTVTNPTVSDATSSNSYGPGQFSQEITGLALNSTYYIKAFATNANGTSYGNQLEIKTLSAGKFGVVSFDSLSFKTTRIIVNIENLGEINIKSIGICYSNTGTPSFKNDSTTVVHSNITDKSFSISLKNLSVNTKYFVRAYINTNLGPFYSDEINFTTKQYTQGTFGDISVTSLSNLSADAKVNILTLGDAPIKSMGLCFATTNDPIFKNDSSTLIHSNVTDLIFSISIKKLNENTKYYIRSFINSDAGISYSKSFYITTLGRPSFTINQTASNITRTSAKVNAQVSSINGGEISEYGFINGTTKYVATAISTDLKYTYDLNSLIGNTQYDFKAFATNKYGIAYSDNFKFLTGPTEPVITTAVANEIFGTNAKSAVLVTSNGGTEITELGLVLSTKSNPTISDRFYVGVSSSAKILLSKLTYDSTYYVRAYAKNKVGVTYGNEINFTTEYKVGETGPAGGIIFYDQGSKKNGWRYMETTLKDIDTLAPGGCYMTVNINTDSAIGKGLENTNKIIELCSESGISARVVKNFTLNNFKDWFLPSYYEIIELFNSNPNSSSPSKAQYVQFVQQGIPGYGYQTSTFQGIVSQANMTFGNYWLQTWTNSGRKDNHYVRPVRRFQ